MCSGFGKWRGLGRGKLYRKGATWLKTWRWHIKPEPCGQGEGETVENRLNAMLRSWNFTEGDRFYDRSRNNVAQTISSCHPLPLPQFPTWTSFQLDKHNHALFHPVPLPIPVFYMKNLERLSFPLNSSKSRILCSPALWPYLSWSHL